MDEDKGREKGPKTLLTRQEAADLAGVSKYKLDQLIRDGIIKRFGPGKHAQVHRASVQAFIEGRFEEASA